MNGSSAWTNRPRPGWAIRFALCVVVSMAMSSCTSVRRLDRHDARSTDSLASYIRRVRAISSEAVPPPRPTIQTAESWDPGLSAALSELAGAPTAARQRRVALEYRRLGIMDKAHAHLTAAVRLDDHDAAAFDGLARIWRDWGFPNLGLDDAYRAVALAPTSAPAANTLGTLLQALGRVRDAGQWYARALKLDANAAYALNNLCYASIVMRQATAVGTCQRAVGLAPESRDARNNLALAYAAAGDFGQARTELERSGGPAVAQYNVGMLYLADRQFGNAIAAFDSAFQLNPRFERAFARAQQARAGAVAEE